jgi:hypothetical protein
MPQDEFITRLFCRIDQERGPVKKYADETLYASEVVTLMVLFAIKGGKFRTFYRWIDYNHRALFPKVPDVTRLLRLFQSHQGYLSQFLADPTLLGIIDTDGIELIHPRREDRTDSQIGRKGLSNGRWIVGVKAAFLINRRGEIIDWAWGTANLADNEFRDVATDYRDEMVVFSDNGFRKKDVDPENMRYCDHGEWNERSLIERMLSQMTEVFNAKKIYHRTVKGVHMRIGAIAAAFNILLKMNDYKPSMTWFAL